MIETGRHLKLLPASMLDIYKVIGHIYMLAQSYPPYWLGFLGSGSLVKSKRCHYIMVEADSHLKLLPSSVLDI